MTEDSPRTIGATTLPLLASLCLTGGVVALVCRTPAHPLPSWSLLVALAAVYLVAAACAHAFAVWAVCRVLRGHFSLPVWPLVGGSWIAFAWVPLLALLVRERSILIAAILPLIAGSAALFLKRWTMKVESLPGETSGSEMRPPLFLIQEQASLSRMLLPPILIAIAFEAAMAALLANRPWMGGCCFGISVVMLIWSFPAKSALRRNGRFPSVWSLVLDSLVVLLLTAVALVPFLESKWISGGFAGLLTAHPSPPPDQAAKHQAQPSGNSYSGIVLLLPAKFHPKVVPPAPAATHGTQIGRVPLKPLVIVFDGAYWFYKNPDPRPKPDAKVEHGDPLKTRIRSADWQPLLMAAHQALGTPIEMSCCSVFRVELVNADDRPGALAIEVQLKNSASKESKIVSLGSMVLRSSDASRVFLNRPPVEEVLNFRLSSVPRGRRFNEITVYIRPARERAMAAVRVAIKDFVLVP
jgi:hypothetical protein